MEHSLREALSRVPEAKVPASAATEEAIEHSERYLGSDEALASIAADTYWPKHEPRDAALDSTGPAYNGAAAPGVGLP
jgi:hypothetical protein